MRSNNSVLRWCLLATAIVFTIIKIYLTDAQGLIAFAQHIHDDALFVNLANAILSGHWLGDYDQYTLIKGPFYPLWIALCNVVNLPLTYSHQLLYIISCAWAVYALRPLLKGHTIWQFAFYSVLLFNPISYQFDVFPRVIRDGIYTPLTLMLVGFCFGLLLRINTSKTQAILWSLGYGLCLSAFWLTREEGIWILPLLLPMMAYTIWKCIGQSNPVQRIIIALNPIFIVILAIMSVASLNWYYYDRFILLEINSKPFVNAYGELTRIQHNEWLNHYPVPRAVREKIYAVSPSFAELSSYFEGEPGKMWIDLVEDQTDISGGLFLWALRDAVASRGYYTSALSATQFYHNIAHEINQACAENRLQCNAPRYSLRPKWRSEYWFAALNKINEVLSTLIMFSKSSSEPLASNGSLDKLIMFQNITNELYNTIDYNVLCPSKKFRIQILSKISDLYAVFSPLLVCIALIAFFKLTFVVIKKSKKFMLLWILCACLLLAVMSRIALVIYIDISSFKAIYPIYLASAYPLITLWVMICLFYLKK